MPPVAPEGQVTCLRQPGRLPAEATGFIGRKAEVAAVAGLLRTARLVTVIGPAGVGKTRVSLQAVAEADAARAFPDGTWLIDLAGLATAGLATAGLAGAGSSAPLSADPAGIGGLVAAALEVAAGPAGLPDYLRDKRLLLILDTCDRVIDACAAFTETLLVAAPGVTVLATSRQPLDAAGEHTFPVGPLPAETEAVELFAQRAAAVVPGFTVDGDNRAEIVRVCRQLDGLPLAIEFAALRLRALPISELAHRLEAGFAVLDATRRGATARHQTLRASLEWSYELCTPPERELWARLSVFAGTFSAGAAEQVCAHAGLPRPAVSEALVGLVDKSVVLRDGTVRHDLAGYRLLPMSRQFGADLLAAAGTEELVFDQLLAYCQDLASDFEEHLRRGGRPEALLALDREYPNVRAALEYALQAAPTRAAGLALRLAGYWQLSGRLAEGEDWLGRVAAGRAPAPAGQASAAAPTGEAAAAAGQQAPTPAAAGRAPAAAGQAPPAAAAGQASAAAAAGQASAAAAGQAAAAAGQAAAGQPAAELSFSLAQSRALAARGRLAGCRGDLAAALKDLTESIRLASADGQRQDEARGYLHLSLALALDGRLAEAQEAAEIAQRQLTPGSDGTVLVFLEAQRALRCALAGDAEQAVSHLDRGYALLAREPGWEQRGERSSERSARQADPAARGPWIARCLHLVAGLALLRFPGRDSESATRLRLALAAADELGDVPGTGLALEAYGWLAARGGKPERAAWLLGAADRIWQRTQVRLDGVAFLAASRADAVARAREALGPRKYEAARARGAAVSLDLAVRVALDSAGEAPAWSGADAGAVRVRAAGIGVAAEFADARAGDARAGDSRAGDARAVDGSGREFGGTGGSVSPAGLTKREWEIAGLVATGLSNREIATRLCISKRTVDAHVEHIFAKLEISSRVQLTVLLGNHPAARQAAGEAGARVAAR